MQLLVNELTHAEQRKEKKNFHFLHVSNLLQPFELLSESWLGEC